MSAHSSSSAGRQGGIGQGFGKDGWGGGQGGRKAGGRKGGRGGRGTVFLSFRLDVLLNHGFEGYVTKFAPHLALKLREAS